uniref:Sema domain-containing protein n=1 Tax=Eptatretus burgeri TaxID=7764 RepID=A0A8C4NBL2_EPTBU
MLSNLHLLSFLLTVSITVSICKASSEWLQFTAPEGISFSHLIPPLNSTRNVVYVAATGRLFLLNTSLKVVANETVCKSGGSKNGHCDNHNQLLSLDASATNLVSCWSADNGICHVRYASNLLRRQGSGGNQLCEYQSVSDNASVVCRLDKARVRIPEGNSRSNSGEGKFVFNHQFVFAFHSSKHLYVLFSRNVQNNGEHHRSSFLGRLCLSDVEAYKSYVEVPLSCGSMDVVHVGAVSAAGQSLDDHADSNQEVLFAAFGRDHQKNGDSSLCAFTLHDLNQKINETYKACYTGGDGASAAYNSPIPCSNNVSCFVSSLLLCPLRNLSNTAVTALILSQELGENVAFLGSRAGHLLKVATIKNIVRCGFGVQVKSVLKCQSVEKIVWYNTVLRLIVVENCGQYKTCILCIRSLDPYCGWCVLQQRCTRKRDCSAKANHWLRSLEHTDCPSVSSLKPRYLSYVSF